MKILKYKYLFALLIIILSGCERNIELDYCQMLELDQSFANNDRADMEKFNADKLKRKNLIRENFKQLVQYSSQNGFPEIGESTATGIDSCKYWFVSITLFHIGQIDPKLLFEDETVEIFKNEIKKGSLRNSLVSASLRQGFKDHEFCKSEKEKIHRALKSWKIQIDELPVIQFKECQN